MLTMCVCPGFGWHGVNYHKKLGVDKAQTTDQNWPNKQDIQYHGTAMLRTSAGEPAGEG